ncbi:hypothetical protein CI610_01263 [invertebrate metagenome]|uniref:Translocator protein BipB-like C-terminal domain-containing protein n=1 Tax=invertebrate metagenome TaxID=1711999 RepID=A0A2H9T933_9ZZZZ
MSQAIDGASGVPGSLPISLETEEIQQQQEKIAKGYNQENTISQVSDDSGNAHSELRSLEPPEINPPSQQIMAEHEAAMEEFGPFNALPETLGLDEEMTNILFKKMLTNVKGLQLGDLPEGKAGVQQLKEFMQDVTLKSFKELPGFEEPENIEGLGKKIEAFFSSMDEEFKSVIDNPSGLFKEVLSGPSAKTDDIVISKLLINPDDKEARASLTNLSPEKQAEIKGSLKKEWAFDVDKPDQMAYFDPANRAANNMDKKTATAVQQMFDFLEVTSTVYGITGPQDLKAEIINDYKKLQKLMMVGNKELWDSDIITMQLVQIQEKLQNNRLKFAQETINIAKIEREQATAKTIKNLREQIAKADQKESANCAQKAFGWIGFVVLVVTAVVTGIVSGGAAAAPLMVAAAVTLMFLIDGETGGTIMSGMVEGLGGDLQGSILATVIITAVMIALTVASAGMASGAAASTLSSTALRVATNLQRAMAVAGGLTAVGSGATQIATATFAYDIEELKADNKDIQALMLRINQYLEDNEDELQKAIEDLQSGFQSVLSILKSNQDTKSQLIRNMSKA